MRGQVRRLQCGPNANAVDVQVRIRLNRTTTLLTAGTSLTPLPGQPDQAGAGAANALVTTTPTAGSRAATPSVQLAFNSRGTGLWFSTIEEESKGFTTATAPNAQYVVDSVQSGAVAVPVDVTLSHTE